MVCFSHFQHHHAETLEKKKLLCFRFSGKCSGSREGPNIYFPFFKYIFISRRFNVQLTCWGGGTPDSQLWEDCECWCVYWFITAVKWSEVLKIRHAWMGHDISGRIWVCAVWKSSLSVGMLAELQHILGSLEWNQDKAVLRVVGAQYFTLHRWHVSLLSLRSDSEDGVPVSGSAGPEHRARLSWWRHVWRQEHLLQKQRGGIRMLSTTTCEDMTCELFQQHACLFCMKVLEIC